MAGASAKGVREAKVALVNLVSAALIKEPSFDADCFASPDTTSGKIVSLVRRISEEDGEFALKLALYVRLDLGLRGTANFLAALAAYSPRCQPFLAVYLQPLVCLPSDWLQVATFARDMPLRATTGLPAGLRKALASTFSKFNEYALAKYNKEKAQAKQRRRGTARDDQNDDATDADAPLQPYTLKQMIRTLHIAHPSYFVMGLLGRRYPQSLEEFQRCGLEAEGHKFDPARCGSRMRLAVPVTWETQLASRGNSAEVWDELVASRSLPFMATLRNLRNIILAGCSAATHESIIARLTSEDQIAASKQFPYRFFSAYDAIDIDPEHAYDAPAPGTSNRPTNKPRKIPPTAPTPDRMKSLLTRYRTALDRAVQLATKCNVRPIHGRTIVAVAAHSDMFAPMVAQGAKGIGSVRSLYEVALLLGVMFKYACERCDFVLFSATAFTVVEDITDGAILKNMSVLKDAATKLSDAAADRPAGSEAREWAHRFPFPLLDGVINRREDVGALVVIDNETSTYEGANDIAVLGDLPAYLRKLRQHCNPELLYVAVDISGKATSVGSGERDGGATAFTHPNDVCISGFSDSILRFVAERGGGGPVRYVENIHKVHAVDISQVRLATELPGSCVALSDDSDDERSGDDATDGDVGGRPRRLLFCPEGESASPAAGKPAPRRPPQNRLTTYKTLRFFISSTFVDMQNERDALVLDVFPALRQRALRRGIKASIVEIDFRWGITSEDAAHNSLNICLNEVARCAPFFVGMYGARRGFCPPPPHKVVPDGEVDPLDFAWLARAEGAASITELETRQAFIASRRRGRNGAGMVLLFRNNAKTVASLPPTQRATFEAENAAAAAALKEFRSVARYEMGDARVASYTALSDGRKLPAQFASTAAGERERVSLDMSEFKRRALRHLWATVVAAAPPPDDDDDDSNNADDVGSQVGDDEADCNLAERAGNPAGVVFPREDEHALFAQHLLKTHVQQPRFASQALRFILGTGSGVPEDVSRHVLAIAAQEGCGKSAVMASLGAVLHASQPGSCVIQFFFGASAADARSCATHIARALISRLHLEDDFVLPTEPTDAALAMLPALYEAAAHHARIIVFIDGLDSCSGPEALLRALPSLVPPNPPLNARFIVSMRHTSPFQAALRGRRPAAFQLAIPDLSRRERASLIRNHLLEFGKKLQESAARGNQLAPLIRKQDSGKPAYLMQALTHLRLFSTFDTLDKDIRSLPSTIGALNGDIVNRFEKLYGARVCGVVLSALVLSASLGGVTEADLYRISPDVATTRRLLNLIDTALVYRDDGAVVMGSDSLASAVRKRYLARTADVVAKHQELCAAHITRRPARPSSSPTTGGISAGPSMLGPTHAYGGHQGNGLNAAYASAAPLAMTATEEEMQQLSPRAMMCGIYHALHGKLFDVLERIVRSVACLEQLVRCGLLPHLLRVLNDLGTVNMILSKKLAPFVDFLTAHRHILTRHPQLLMQCALNMPRGTAVGQAAWAHLEAEGDEADSDWIQWTNRDAHGEKECTQVTAMTSQAVLCIAFDEKAEQLAVGGADWLCRVVRQIDGSIVAKLQHPNSVTTVVFSSQQQRQLITGCDDGVIRVWSLVDGAVVQKCTGHSRRINQLALHPTAPTLLSASDDCTARLWNLGLAQPTLRAARTLRKHTRPISCCAYHQGGAVYATGGWDAKVIFWHAETETLFHVKRGAVRAMAFVPSMVVTLAVASYSGHIDLFDVAAGHVSATLDEHLSRPVTSLAFSRDAKRMLSSDVGGRALVWRVGVVGEVLGVLFGHATPVNAAAFVPKDRHALVTASDDATVRHWLTAADDAPIGAVHGAEVAAVSFVAQRGLALTAGRDGKLHAHELADPTRRVLFTIAHGAPITAAAATTDEIAVVVTGGVDGTVRVWRSEPGLTGRDGALLFYVPRTHRQPVIAIRCRGSRVCTASCDGAVMVFDAAVPKKPPVTVVLPIETELRCVEWLDDLHIGAFTECGGSVVFACAPLEQQQQPPSIWDDAEVDIADADGRPSEPGAHFVPAPDAAVEFDGPQAIRALSASASSHNGEWLAFGSRTGAVALTPNTRHADPNAVRTLRHALHEGAAVAVAGVAFAGGDELVVAAACSDLSVRVLRAAAAGGAALSQTHLFFATAAVTAVGSTAGGLVAGDALGNVYTAVVQWSRRAAGAEGGVRTPALWSRAGSCALDGDGDDESDDESFDAESEAMSSTSDASRGTTAERDATEAAELRHMELLQMLRAPTHLGGQDRRAWHLRKRELLKEAARGMKRSTVARLAVRAHAQETMRAFGAYSSSLAQQ